MDIQVIERYIREFAQIEITHIQELFGLKYSDAVMVMAELEERGVIKYLDGFNYAVNRQAPELQEPTEDEEGVEEENGEDGVDHEFEKMKLEMLELLKRAQTEDRQKAKEEHDKISAELKGKCREMPEYNAEDETFSLGMSVAYPDGTPFRLKAVEHGVRWYLSDCGATVKYLSALDQQRDLIDYLEYRLSSETMALFDNELCTPIDDIHDLPSEGVFLLKLVNGLVMSVKPAD